MEIYDNFLKKNLEIQCYYKSVMDQIYLAKGDVPTLRLLFDEAAAPKQFTNQREQIICNVHYTAIIEASARYFVGQNHLPAIQYLVNEKGFVIDQSNENLVEFAIEMICPKIMQFLIETRKNNGTYNTKTKESLIKHCQNLAAKSKYPNIVAHMQQMQKMLED